MLARRRPLRRRWRPRWPDGLLTSAVEPLDELLRHPVDVFSFRTPHMLADLDLVHLLHRHLPGRPGAGTGRSWTLAALARTDHLP